jgi:hypothetical protein
MKTPKSHIKSICDLLANSPDCASRFLWSTENSISLDDVLHGTILGGRTSELYGRSVLLVVRDQLAAALAIIELDGIARRLIICPPDIAPDYIPTLIQKADAGAMVCDEDVTHRPHSKWTSSRLAAKTLPRHKVPAILSFVPALNISPAGKMGRTDA